MPTPTAVEIVLSVEERSALESWTARRKTAQALALRARIVLGAAGQLTNREIAELEGVSARTVTKWRNRFAELSLQGLAAEPHPGRPRTITDEQVENVIITTLESNPKDGSKHWSTRTMAAEAGVTQNAVVRIWHAYGLQPHRQETWKLSKDPLRRARSRHWTGLRRRSRCCPAPPSARRMTMSATGRPACTRR